MPVEDAGVAGPVVFVLAGGVLGLALFPGQVTATVAGMLFGAVAGTVLALAAALLAAALCFAAGRRLGADALLGTHLAFDVDDRVTGAFGTPNCRGEEKVRRLRDVYGPDLHLAAAYGDTSGDTEMIAIAGEKGFRVFTGRP